MRYGLSLTLDGVWHCVRSDCAWPRSRFLSLVFHWAFDRCVWPCCIGCHAEPHKKQRLVIGDRQTDSTSTGAKDAQSGHPSTDRYIPLPPMRRDYQKGCQGLSVCNHEFPPEPPTVKPLPIHTVGTTRFARDIAKPGELVVCSSCNIEADAENHKCPYCNTSLYTRTTDAELYDRRKKEV